MSENMTFRMSSDTLTKDIEAMQALLNTARVQAGSQYGALESAVNYTTDLTAQYELGYNTVNDVNFSMETAHLAKNQILQQAATAMLAQANSGQQGLLQLINKRNKHNDICEIIIIITNTNYLNNFRAALVAALFYNLSSKY